MYKPLFQKREVLVFRRFQRKGYSLFACLGREVVISVLSVAMLSSVKAASISDEVWRADSAKTVKEVWLGDVGVTGSRAPLTQSQAARMVTVLSREDVQAAPVQSINDLLKMAVGVDVRQRGALGAQTDVSIRGGTQEQVIVLLNGINICDPQTGHNVMDLPVQLSEIVRIEVLEGPAGRVYGTSSLVGAINIVTHPQRSTGADIGAEAGSYGMIKVEGRANLQQRGWNNQLSASYMRSDGFGRAASGSLNTDYRGSKAFYQGRYDDEQVSVSWHAGLTEKGWGSSTFYASPKWQADDQYEHTTKAMTALQAETKKGFIHLRPGIYWNQNYDRYEGYRGRPDKMKYNYNRCDVYGLILNGYFDWTFGRTALGAELRNEDLVSTNLGEPLLQPHHISGTSQDYVLGINRTNLSAHLEHNILWDHLTVSAGFVAMKSTQSAMNWQLYPGVDASYRFNDHWKVYASCNTSMRLPSFTEMYYKLQGYAADPHLKPEEMLALEVGTRYSSTAVQAKVSAFHHRGKDMIDWMMDTSLGEQAEWQSVNHTRLSSYGIEAELTLDLGRLLPWQNKLQRFGVSYVYMDQDKQLEPNIVSQYALEYLRHKLLMNLDLRMCEKMSLGLYGRWQDRVGNYTSFQNEVMPYRPFFLLDARLSWMEPDYSLYAKVNNVLNNRNYVDYGCVPQPGIWVTLGGCWHF